MSEGFPATPFLSPQGKKVGREQWNAGRLRDGTCGGGEIQTRRERQLQIAKANALNI